MNEKPDQTSGWRPRDAVEWLLTGSTIGLVVLSAIGAYAHSPLLLLNLIFVPLLFVNISSRRSVKNARR